MYSRFLTAGLAITLPAGSSSNHECLCNSPAHKVVVLVCIIRISEEEVGLTNDCDSGRTEAPISRDPCSFPDTPDCLWCEGNLHEAQ